MITAFLTPEERKDFDSLFSNKINIYLNKSGECRWPGCTEKAIGPHSISKSISLMPISEDGHMIGKKSKREGESKKVLLRKIGNTKISQRFIQHIMAKKVVRVPGFTWAAKKRNGDGRQKTAALKKIAENITRSTGLTEEIAAASNEQARNITRISWRYD